MVRTKTSSVFQPTPDLPRCYWCHAGLHSALASSFPLFYLCAAPATWAKSLKLQISPRFLLFFAIAKCSTTGAALSFNMQEASSSITSVIFLFYRCVMEGIPLLQNRHNTTKLCLPSMSWLIHFDAGLM